MTGGFEGEPAASRPEPEGSSSTALRVADGRSATEADWRLGLTRAEWRTSPPAASAPPDPTSRLNRIRSAPNGPLPIRS
jgi:hypothetical protein